jgi:glutamate--cysteine ligase
MPYNRANFPSSDVFGPGVCDQLWLKAIRPSLAQAATPHFGLEVEMFGYWADTLEPLAGHAPLELMSTIQSQVNGSSLKHDPQSGLLIGVHLPSGGNFSLEPGGQVEYSSRPTATFDELVQDVLLGFSILERASAGQMVFLGTGTNPLSKADHPLVLPKERYQVMTRYFESIPGGRGIHMMRHTATVQPNIEIGGHLSDWQDAVNLTFALTPFVKHIFANSPFFQGHAAEGPSERQAIWPFVDSSRTGIPKNVPFEADVACEYAKWAKAASVFYVPGLPLSEQPLPNELPFEKWLNEGYKGTQPNLQDWENHLGTLFPDLRLRGFLEVRSIDCQPLEHLFAPMAFFHAALLPEGRESFWRVLQPLAALHQTLSQGTPSVTSAEEAFRFLLLEDPNHITFQNSLVHSALLDTALFVLRQKQEWTAFETLAAFQNALKQVRNVDGFSPRDYVAQNATSHLRKTVGKHVPARLQSHTL